MQSQRTSLVQEQQLKLNPRMIQALRLLALPLLDLSEEIRQELEENPALELVEDGASVSLDTLESEREQAESDHESLYDGEYSDSSYDGNMAAGSDRMAFLQQAVASEETLQQHLLSQLGLLPLDDEEMVIASRLIQNLDDNGFHILPPEELCPECPPEQLARILSHLQRLDPPGTCTANYRESLMVQAMLSPEPPKGTLEILRDHFSDLESRNHAILRKATGLSEEAISAVLEFIRTLQPFPGRAFSGAGIRYIVPDLAMWLEDGEIKIRLNDGTIPKLSISRLYEELASHTVRGDAEKFARENVERARFFIDAVRRRNETLLKTAYAIAEHQQDFFTMGPRGLKPLTLKDIAAKIGMHEATVSRIVNGKYAQTDWGVMELRRFFTNAVSANTQGGTLSKEAVKAEIVKILDELAGKGAKVTDRILAEMLHQRGIEVARRTVAKYRAELGR
ncbi:MAG: RNA polymerase factor sigma-54 [Spirochaetales bacterium]|nr:RNA polymerase factor sigma-54 [Spirochaetales bacterium]